MVTIEFNGLLPTLTAFGWFRDPPIADGIVEDDVRCIFIWIPPPPRPIAPDECDLPLFTLRVIFSRLNAVREVTSAAIIFTNAIKVIVSVFPHTPLRTFLAFPEITISHLRVTVEL